MLALAPALLAGCGNDADPGPGGVTVGEARALDEAAAMLDSQRLPDAALDNAPQLSPSDADAAPAQAPAPPASDAATPDWQYLPMMVQ